MLPLSLGRCITYLALGEWRGGEGVYLLHRKGTKKAVIFIVILGPPTIIPEALLEKGGGWGDQQRFSLGWVSLEGPPYVFSLQPPLAERSWNPLLSPEGGGVLYLPPDVLWPLRLQWGCLI